MWIKITQIIILNVFRILNRFQEEGQSNQKYFEIYVIYNP